MNAKRAKYDTGVNIIGSIPDYADMIRYIASLESKVQDKEFTFRTSESTRRFRFAIEAHIIQFNNDAHKSLFMNVMADPDLPLQSKFITQVSDLEFKPFEHTL